MRKIKRIFSIIPLHRDLTDLRKKRLWIKPFGLFLKRLTDYKTKILLKILISHKSLCAVILLCFVRVSRFDVGF